MKLLHPGDAFPSRALSLPGGGTLALIDEYGLSLPVGHSADAAALRETLGAFVTGDHVESTGFVLGPDGRVIVSVYSSGAIGRLMPDDVVGLIRYKRVQASTVA